MKSVRRALEPVLTVAGLVWLAFFLSQNRDLTSQVFNSSLPDLLLLLALVLGGWIAISTQSLVLLRSQSVRLSAVESLFVHAATSLLNYVPMRLGTLLRLRYLRVVHSLGYGRALGLIVLRLSLFVVIAAGMTLLGIALIGGGGEAAVVPLVASCFGALAAIAVLVFIVRPIRNDGPIARIWNVFAEAFRTGRKEPGVMAAVFVLIIAQLGFGALRMDLAFDITGVPVDLSVLLIVTPVTVLLGLFSFATLGVREAIIGGLVVLTGLDFTAGVIAASVERGALIVLSAILGAPGAWIMTRRINQTNGAL